MQVSSASCPLENVIFIFPFTVWSSMFWQAKIHSDTEFSTSPIHLPDEVLTEVQKQGNKRLYMNVAEYHHVTTIF